MTLVRDVSSLVRASGRSPEDSGPIPLPPINQIEERSGPIA